MPPTQPTRSDLPLLYADLAASLRAGPPDPALRAAVASDLERRWRGGASPPALFRSERAVRNLVNSLLILLLALAIIVLWTLLVTASPSTLVVLIPALTIATIAGPALVARAYHQRWTRRSKARLCGSCLYDLSSHADAVEPAQLGGRHIGPPGCPECGTHWPLVPRVIQG